jgi:hypothetical protein
MEYLHMQKPKPTDATGVQVKLAAVDSSGNSVDIGTATTDTNGNFGFAWTPDKEGTYKIVATFAGTNSYGNSEASTYLTVSQAAPDNTSPSTASVTSTDTIIFIAIAAIALIVAVIAVFFAVRKR